MLVSERSAQVGVQNAGPIETTLSCEAMIELVIERTSSTDRTVKRFLEEPWWRPLFSDWIWHYR